MHGICPLVFECRNNPVGIESGRYVSGAGSSRFLPKCVGNERGGGDIDHSAVRPNASGPAHTCYGFSLYIIDITLCQSDISRHTVVPLDEYTRLSSFSEQARCRPTGARLSGLP